MDRHLIDINATLREALKKLNDLSGATMTLFAIDSEGIMHGTITDGDIRRAVISGVDLEDAVHRAMHRNFSFLSSDGERVEHIRDARRRGIRLLPVLDRQRHLLSVVDLSHRISELPLSAVIMAGGKGERLRPLTLTTPKPLLEIGGKAIIDYNVEALIRCGITDITVTTNYLAEKIEKHFDRAIDGVKVKCVREPLPLGTIGSAALADIPEQGNTLVMNSDLLTTIDLEEMFLRHTSLGADITIAAIPYTVSVPYAILTTEGQQVTALQEKPTYSHFANAGIYIFSNVVLNSLNPDERTDATTLIEAAMQQGMKVTYYPISGTWIDIGSPADFAHAQELMKHHRTISA